MFEIGGAVDLAHAASADPFADPVTAREDFAFAVAFESRAVTESPVEELRPAATGGFSSTQAVFGVEREQIFYLA
ncbi:MAG: hypothetical protein U0Q16_18675 [Bryobacteraceae bacterium]